MSNGSNTAKTYSSQQTARVKGTRSFIKLMVNLKQIQTATKIQPATNNTPIIPGRKATKFQTHYRQADFLTLFVQNNGLVLKTCNQLKLGYHTLKKWSKEPKFKEKYEIAQQRVNEIMEDSLIRKAMETNSAVPEIFYLKSRDPRYKPSVALEGDEDKPIQVTYNTETLKVISKAITGMLEKE